MKTFQQPLTSDEEAFYIRLMQEDSNGEKGIEARNILIERNLRLVAHIAKKYQAKIVQFNMKMVDADFSDYVKNVASSEIYPTWDESALRANIYAQISFALNSYLLIKSFLRSIFL